LTCINFAVSNQLHGAALASEPQSNQPKLLTEVIVHLLRFCSVLLAILATSGTLAADADNGKRLAEMRCVTCHIVSPTERRDVTDAPPFEAIARKFATNPDTLAFSIIDPHPRDERNADAPGSSPTGSERLFARTAPGRISRP
jgi:hypothetical protein